MTFEVYEDRAGEWRWRLRSGNNVDIVATSGEGYDSKSNCKRAIESVKAGVPNAEVVEVED